MKLAWKNMHERGIEIWAELQSLRTWKYKWLYMSRWHFLHLKPMKMYAKIFISSYKDVIFSHLFYSSNFPSGGQEEGEKWYIFNKSKGFFHQSCPTLEGNAHLWFTAKGASIVQRQCDFVMMWLSWLYAEGTWNVVNLSTEVVPYLLEFTCFKLQG